MAKYEFNTPNQRGLEEPTRKFGKKVFKITCQSCDAEDHIPMDVFTELRENMGWKLVKGKWSCCNCHSK